MNFRFKIFAVILSALFWLFILSFSLIMAEEEDALIFQPLERIGFYSGEEFVGSIDWSSGTVKFEGNVEDSAREFLEFVFDYAPFCKEQSEQCAERK